MKLPRILVAGATGKTGSQTVLQLLERGFPVRALVHREDGRSDALRRLGAQVQVGNLHDIDHVMHALEGVRRAYFCAPLLRDALGATMVFATAAQERRLEAVVVLSQWLADPRHPSIHTRETWLADQAFSWMPDVGVITINPGWFADNYMVALEPISQFGLMPMPLGAGRNAPPSNEDIARVAVAAISNPARHIGKRYRPTGPELLSPTEIAQAFSRVLGRRVRYFDAPTGMFTKVARAIGFPDFTTAQVLTYFEDYRRDSFAVGAPTQVVMDLCGRPPEDFESIVRRYVALSPAASRSAGSLARAWVRMLRIIATPSLDPAAYASEHDMPGLAKPQLAVDSIRWSATHALAAADESAS